ncbi:unnamed protein product [Victoria cruziana]
MDRRDDANQQEPSNVPSRSAAVTSTEASETRSASEPEVALRNVLAAHRRRRSDPESKQESVGGHLTMVGNMQSGEVSDGESRSPGSSGVSPAAVGDDTRISINANIKDDGNRRSGWRTKTAASSAGRRTETGTASRKGAESEKPKFAEPIGREKLRTECDLFDGRWVRDESYPYYPAGSCPYVETPTSCYQNGRPDRNYEKWRWQPHGCNISRLDPKDMLERLRGKRLAFVGDSLNRNMWRSLICLLWSSLEDKTRMVGVSGQHEYGTTSATVFRFLDYNFTLEFFWSAFLVDEQQISHPNGTVQKKLRLDNMATFASSYRDADILIFNSGHWWVPAKTNDGKNFYELGNSMYGYLEAERAYLRALMTWADWVDANVNPNKTRVFFRGYSNVHYSGGQWNSGGHCHKEVEPIANDADLSQQPREMRLAEIVLSKMTTPVTYLNITKLTDYRKDAHPSIYTSPKIVPEKFQDCSHWCLPGVPDTWNELLYASLVMKAQLDEAD